MKLLALAGLIALAMAEADLNSILKESNDQFTANMFTEVVKENPGKSVILSAFSVLSPLAQLASASVGESHDEILRVMRFPNENVTKHVFESLHARLRLVKGVDLKMANRIYIAQDATLNPTFAQMSRDVFNSDVKNVDFAQNEKTANEVNVWVEDQTNHKIKDLIDPKTIDGTTRAMLVNAIYFKGTWKNKFEKTATRDEDFHVTTSKTVKVPTMHKTANYRYGESETLDAKLLEIPYEGDEASFLIVLPKQIDGLSALQEKLKDPFLLNEAINNMYSTEVKVSLPKFKIETRTDLKKILQNMQVKLLFSPRARLENLLKNEANLIISDAIQKAFIEVNEEGAEAAAANAFVSLMAAHIPSTPKSFVVDKPFYYQIVYNHLPMFDGVYHEP